MAGGADPDGRARNPLARRLARALERFVYRRSARVIALSPGIRDGVIAAGVPAARVVAGAERIRPGALLPHARPRRRSGAAWASATASCALLRHHGRGQRPVPGGARRAAGGGRDVRAAGRRQAPGELRREAERLGAANVVFLDPAPDKAAVARLAAASDACLTIFKDVPILSTNSPNKLFDTFAAGPGRDREPARLDAASWWRTTDAGLYAAPGDPADLAEKVAWLRDHPDGWRATGATRARSRSASSAATRWPARALDGSAEAALVTVLSYCVVNTNGREHLPACLDAIARTHPAGLEHEVLVLDNASGDGSADAVRGARRAVRLIALDRRRARPRTTRGCCARPAGATACC